MLLQVCDNALWTNYYTCLSHSDVLSLWIKRQNCTNPCVQQTRWTTRTVVGLLSGLSCCFFILVASNLGSETRAEHFWCYRFESALCMEIFHQILIMPPDCSIMKGVCSIAEMSFGERRKEGMLKKCFACWWELLLPSTVSIHVKTDHSVMAFCKMTSKTVTRNSLLH